MDVEKKLLSGSTNGRPIKVAATSTPGTLIHTVSVGTDSMDEIYLYAVNTSASAVVLTVEFGGTTSPDHQIKISLEPDQGLYLVVPGLPLQNGAVVRAFAGTTNVINVAGFVNRVYQ